VVSPSAANTGADLRSNAAVARGLGVAGSVDGDMVLDVFHLLIPATAIHAGSLGAALGGYSIEARLDDTQQGAAFDFLQLEHHPGGWLVRKVVGCIQRARVPMERQQELGLDPFQRDFEQQMLVTRVGDVTVGGLAGNETMALQRHAKPVTEGLGVGDHAPHPRA
jgi:hypothetical protein